MQMPDSLHYSPLSPVFVATTNIILTKWQLMRHFHCHTNSGLFPHGHQLDTAILPEESILLWTLLQPTLDSPWRQTYVWNEQLDQLVQAIDNCDPQSTYQQFSRFFQGACISKALWSSSGDFGPLPKLPFANSESNDWWLPSIHTQPHSYPIYQMSIIWRPIAHCRCVVAIWMLEYPRSSRHQENLILMTF